MFRNTDQFYFTAKEYQDKRKSIIDEYENRLESLKDARGSKLYEDETKKAEDKKNNALTALKMEYAEYFNSTLAAMIQANGNRQMKPPTEEELRTLQLLKMKDKPTEAELQAAANTLKGNATCLSILTEISHNAGYMRGYDGYTENKEMPVETAERIIKGLASSVSEFMEYDTNRAARVAREHHERIYGTVANAPALEKRPLFEDKAGCFREIAGLSGDYLTAFENAVDG